jgi:hypothetical protein
VEWQECENGRENSSQTLKEKVVKNVCEMDAILTVQRRDCSMAGWWIVGMYLSQRIVDTSLLTERRLCI